MRGMTVVSLEVDGMELWLYHGKEGKEMRYTST